MSARIASLAGAVCAGCAQIVGGTFGDASVGTDGAVDAPDPPAAELRTSADEVVVRLVDGRTFAWGENALGVLGRANLQAGPRELPVPRFASLRVSANTACRLDPDGALWCWGANPRGQLGPRTWRGVVGPEGAVRVMDDARDVVVAPSVVCALRGDRRVWCLGSNAAGALGEPALDLVRGAAPISGVADVAAIGETLDPIDATVCAMAGDVTRCWGSPASAAFGGGDPWAPVPVPRELPMWAGSRQLIASAVTTCARDAAGRVGCAGEFVDAEGRAFRGSEAAVFRAQGRVELPGFAGSAQIALGVGVLCAVDGARTVRCAGINGRGQIGNGRVTPFEEAQRVPGLADVAEVRCGRTFCCARTRGGEVWCWGDNARGQLGRSPSELPRSPTPLRVRWG